jgi:hypothetical protein
VDFIRDPGQREQVTRKQRASRDSLTVYSSSIRTAQIAKVDQAIRLDQHAVLFRDARVINNQIAQFGASANHSDRTVQRYGCPATFGDKLCEHV